MTQAPTAPPKSSPPRRSFLYEMKDLIKALLWALLIAGLVRSFIFEPFTIPSGSMIPTLLVGDYIYVDKRAYGYGRWSFPFGLINFSGRFAFSPPQQGDIIVFKAPREDDDKFYIKRLIGLPGHSVQVKQGRLYIDDALVPWKEAGRYRYQDEQTKEEVSADRYLETLPNGTEHYLLKGIPFGMSRYDDTIRYVVPEDHYFMMGDNRDYSSDSRNRVYMGDIHKDKLVGKAIFIFFSTTAKWYQLWDWLSGIRYYRLFKNLYSLSWQEKAV